MKNVLIKNGIIFATLWLLIGASTAIGSEKYLGHMEQLNEQKMAIIQIGGSRPGVGGEQIKVPLSQVEQIKDKINALLEKAKENNFKSEEFIESLLKIFREERILSKEYTYENLTLFAKKLFDKISKQNMITKYLSPLQLFKSSLPNGISSLSNNVTPPDMQIGILTIKGTVALGGSFGWGVPLTPFNSSQGIWHDFALPLVKEIFHATNATAEIYWTFSPNILLRLPGSPMGGTGIASLIPFPGFSDFQTALWIGRTCLGLEIGLLGLGIIAFFKTEISTQILFDSALQIFAGTGYISYIPPS